MTAQRSTSNDVLECCKNCLSANPGLPVEITDSEGSSDPTRDKLLDSWRTEIEEWVRAIDKDGRRKLCLFDVFSASLFEEVETICEELGIKAKYDWEAASGILSLRKSSILEESIGRTILDGLDAVVASHLRQPGVALCGRPIVHKAGSGRLQLENGDKREPDESFWINMLRGSRYVYSPTPTVLIETAVSLQYCKPDTDSCRVEISVWARDPLLDIGTRPCQFMTDGEASQHDLPLATANEWLDGCLEAIGPIFTHNGLTIRCRNTCPIVVFDQALGNDQPANPTLRLHVYDLIAPCERYPTARIPVGLQWINIPLNPLQEMLHMWFTAIKPWE
ncbi:hypothetical protein RhiJN_21824 [Ceratobasidium sp. AG-Ba]|nr:hypothetical protein RhiJN_21824 [Ceratobasidium sp. AG-Ba]